MNRGTFVLVHMLAILATVGRGIYDTFIPEGNAPRTPHMPHRGRHHRYKPHISNGKWVMKYHRGR